MNVYLSIIQTNKQINSTLFMFKQHLFDFLVSDQRVFFQISIFT